VPPLLHLLARGACWLPFLSWRARPDLQQRAATGHPVQAQALTARMSENCLEPTLSAPTMNAFS
jgi:hypothetical protein